MLSQYQQDFLGTLDFAPLKEYVANLFSVESTYEFGGAYLIEAYELQQFNADYKAQEFYPGHLLIGSDGGGEAFAIEKADSNFV